MADTIRALRQKLAEADRITLEYIKHLHTAERDSDTARAECERLAALAYIGDHRFPDLTYKSRLDECAHDLRKAESERAAARRDLAAAQTRLASLEIVLRDIASDGCEYGDGCPQNVRHYRCRPCMCAAVLEKEQGNG